ncbi:uncharacterized protein OCT59_029498 [Rhizophagus irregularis]|uniref:uncharacterized protein n=1 Tax=Rhizophagus irregularis TaxID=588596 RepID=UPI00331AB8F5|nr:hypothetical protein OCT59_029498 [Rhizophagus irregularis]
MSPILQVIPPARKNWMPSSENFDYYGITDETSCGDYICPLCKLGHDDEEIEGEYKAGSYFIKCEQHEIEITA